VNWFKHDTDATTDAKLKKLIIRHGAVGYAVYFHCLELIAGDVTESNITFQLEHDSEIIAENLHIKGSADQSGIAIVEEIMRTIIALCLFQESGGHIFCFKLLKRIDLSMTGNSKLRAAITGARADHDAIMISHDAIMLGKGSIGECSGVQEKEVKHKKKKEATAPRSPATLEEIKTHFEELKYKQDPEEFFNYWESVGWKRKNGQKIVDWKATARNYVKKSWAPLAPPKPDKIIICPQCGEREYDHICRNAECPQYTKGKHGAN
jgi:hypothetical protein